MNIPHAVPAIQIRPHHAALSVADLDDTIAWYGRMFGFELERREHVPHIPADVAFLRNGAFRLELFQVPHAAPLPADRRVPDADLRTHGHKHVCFGVPDAAAAIQALRAKGADIVMERDMNGVRIAFLRDNTGNLIEVLHAPELFADAT